METNHLNEQDLEAIRRKNLESEANLRSLEIIYYVLSVIFIGLGLIFFARIFYIGFFDLGLCVVGMALLTIAGFLFWLGRQFRKLHLVAGIVGSVVAGIGLLAFPLGTLLGAMTLYFIWCEKGRYIFSPEYRAVIAATPAIKCRPGGVILLFFILVASLAALILLAIIFNYHGGLP